MSNRRRRDRETRERVHDLTDSIMQNYEDVSAEIVQEEVERRAVRKGMRAIALCVLVALIAGITAVAFIFLDKLP